ncbi:MAG: hypothetical protein HY335_07735 [Deinococcus sp.]|nr:hypothetical protein [Deinococcus sp.]
MGKDTTLYKIGGGCAIVGAIVVAIALLMHPAEGGTPEEALRMIANHNSYGSVHWAVVVGDFLIIAAALALYRALTAERECGFAFYATAAMVGGKLLGTGATVLLEATSSPAYARAYQQAADATAKAAVAQAYAPLYAYSQQGLRQLAGLGCVGGGRCRPHHPVG